MSLAGSHLPDAGKMGPLPVSLIAASRLTTLELVASASKGLQQEHDFSSQYTSTSLLPLFITCAVSCRRTLTRLNLTGLGSLVFRALISLDLPRLRVLELGEATHEQHRPPDFGVPYEPGALGALGAAFPTLTALDVGYASFEGGVSFRDINALLTHAPALAHLDLSQVAISPPSDLPDNP